MFRHLGCRRISQDNGIGLRLTAQVQIPRLARCTAFQTPNDRHASGILCRTGLCNIMSTPVATAIHDINSELAGQPSMSLRCMEWFAARKISAKTLLRNHIVEKEVCMSTKSSETEIAIVFPSVYDGQVRGLKYRTLPRRWSQSTDFHTIWYGVDDIVGQDTVIIVEGETDKLALEEAGFRNAVSVPNGAPEKVKNGPLPEPAADKAFQYVWNCWTELEQASCILLGTDNDLPGHALAEELARRLGRERCLRINWTIDTTCNPNLGNTDSDICTVRKDANEMLIQDGVAAVQHCVNNPQPLLAEGPYRVHRKVRRGRQQTAATPG